MFALGGHGDLHPPATAFDAFPKSKYLKQSEKIYDGANKGLEKVAKYEQEVKEFKAKEAARVTKEKEDAAKEKAKKDEKVGKNK